MNKDAFANRFAVAVTEAAIGTPAYAEVPTYASAFSKEAFIIHRLEFTFPPALLQLLVAAGDSITAVLTTANHFTALIPSEVYKEPGVIDFVELHTGLFGTAANMLHEQLPIIHDFTSLPGGGLIVPARPIYVGVQGVALGSYAIVQVRGYFTKVDLKDQEFLELLDAYRMVR